MRTPLLLSLSLILASCGDQNASAAGTNPLANAANEAGKALGGIADVAKQTDAAKSAFSALGDLQKALGGITDGASATAAKSTLEGLVGKLGGSMKDLQGVGKLADTVKAALGGGDLNGIMKTVTDKIGALLGNEQVKSAIGPVLEQLKGLIKI